MAKETVLVTNAMNDAGVYAAGALASAGYQVIGTDFGRLPFNIRSRFAREYHSVSGRNAQEFETDFLELLSRKRPAALLPIGSRFAHACIVHRSRIEATTAVNVPSLEAYFAAFDKRQCMTECRELGIPHPSTYTLVEAQALLSGANPSITLVVKPDVDAGAASGVSYVRSHEALIQAFNRCTADFGGALIQEYIPGGADAMKAVTLLFAPDTRLVAAFTMQKLRQWPSQGGNTVIARSTVDERLVDQMLPFFQRWKWCGCAEVELKFDARDGHHKVIEINPRFPGYLRFIGQCGVNLPALAVSLALDGQDVPAIQFPGYEDSVGYCSPGGLLESVITDLSGTGSKLALVRAVIADLRRARPKLGGMLQDPLPVIGRVFHRLTGSPGLGSTFHLFPVKIPVKKGSTMSDSTDS